MPETRVLQWDGSRTAERLVWAVRVMLAVAFAVAVFVPLDQLEGKAMAFRAPLFALSMLVIPLASRGRVEPPARTADVLIVTPFVLDTLGNVFGFYDTFANTDDVLHAVNWFLLVAAFHAWRFRRVGDVRDARLIGAGVGALAIVGWELAEWAVAESGAGGGLALTYADTIGDLALSTGGGIVGSLVAVAIFGVVGTSRPADRRRDTAGYSPADGP